MPFESWTGVLRVQSYFQIIDIFIFGTFYLILNLIVFVTARDIHGFLTLSSRLQIHENAIEIDLPETRFQRRKVPNRLWIITLTYLTGRTSKLHNYDITKSLTFHIFEAVFFSQQSSTFT